MPENLDADRDDDREGSLGEVLLGPVVGSAGFGEKVVVDGRFFDSKCLGLCEGILLVEELRNSLSKAGGRVCAGIPGRGCEGTAGATGGVESS